MATPIKHMDHARLAPEGMHVSGAVVHSDEGSIAALETLIGDHARTDATVTGRSG